MPEATERDSAETNRLPTAGPQPVYGFDDISNTFEPVYSTGNALHVKVLSGGSSTAPEQLPVKAQTSLTGDGTSKQLPAQVGTTYALIQVKSSSLSFRIDGAAATVGGASEQTLSPDSRIELLSALEIANFRCIQAAPGLLSIIYRGV